MSAIAPDYAALAARIRALAQAAGFQRFGISGVELPEDEAFLRSWLQQGLHGSMAWMARHGDKRARPAELVPGTLRVITAQASARGQTGARSRAHETLPARCRSGLRGLQEHPF